MVSVTSRINLVLLVVATTAALGFGWITAKKALAFPGTTCANIIGTANCPPGFTQGQQVPFGYTCHSSSPWYVYNIFGQVVQGPYYDCCVYDRKIQFCNSPGYTYSDVVQYFKVKKNGAGYCSSTSSDSEPFCMQI